MNLSDHFTYDEAIASQTAARKGIDNTPDSAALEAMLRASVKLEKVRELLHAPMHINSWYRCPQLNFILGSKTTSQHIVGEAIDFICPNFGDPLAVCKKIIDNADLIRFDQLILEHTWVHISFAILSGKPRNQVLSLLTGGHYSSGLTDKNGKPL